jgi:hypothetical protein
LTSPTYRRRPCAGGDEHQAELSIKAQAQISSDQRKAIDHWSKASCAGTRSLSWSRAPIAGACADGTYPVPDANNPFADPQFPFGNPPYAVRAYSYVTVAQLKRSRPRTRVSLHGRRQRTWTAPYRR